MNNLEARKKLIKYERDLLELKKIRLTDDDEIIRKNEDMKLIKNKIKELKDFLNKKVEDK